MAKTLRGEADLLHGPVLQNMLRFALPILAGTLLQQLYSMVDAVVVGQFVGKTALAAVGGSAVAIINLLLNFFVGLCSGAAIVVAQYYGAHDHENVRRAVHTATLLAVWVGAIMTVIGVCFAPGLLSAGLSDRARHAGGYHAVFHRLYALVFCRDGPHDDL